MSIVWQYLDKKGAAMNALKDYSSMQYILTHTNENVVTHLEQNNVLQERYRQAVEYMDWFLPAWEALSADEQFVLRAFYLEEGQKQIDAIYTICEHFHIERSSAYNKKNRALQHLALLLYGK